MNCGECAKRFTVVSSISRDIAEIDCIHKGTSYTSLDMAVCGLLLRSGHRSIRQSEKAGQEEGCGRKGEPSEDRTL